MILITFCAGWRATTPSTPPSPPLAKSLTAATTSSSPQNPPLHISHRRQPQLRLILLHLARPTPISTPQQNHCLPLSIIDHLHHLPIRPLLINLLHLHIISNPLLNHLNLLTPLPCSPPLVPRPPRPRPRPPLLFSPPPAVPPPLVLSLPNQCTLLPTLREGLQQDQART